MSEIRIESSWKEVLSSVFEQSFFQEVSAFVKSEIRAGQTIYPHPKNIFAAFNATPFSDVRVVILGQDPYHGAEQAHGLSFSVMPGVRTPPSLQNIYKELHRDIGMDIPSHGDLTSWAQQGVLLLNATLTVRAGQPTSHSGQGWEDFTDAVIRTISDKQEAVVFLLWGAYASKKQDLIDIQKHHVLTSTHPSPFSAHRGFLGCGHFSKVNELLIASGKKPIDWDSVNRS